MNESLKQNTCLRQGYFNILGWAGESEVVDGANELIYPRDLGAVPDEDKVCQ